MTKFILIAAVSIDGRITKADKDGSSWTSPEDKDFLHGELDKCDAVIVGRTTYKTAKKPLSRRDCFVITSQVKKSEKKQDNLTFINPSALDIREFFAEYNTIALLGGTQVYTYFLQNDLVDEIYLTIEPLVFGSGKTLFNEFYERKFRLKTMKKLTSKGTIVLHYILNS